MKTGLLWYDDNPTRSLTEKIALAAARYRQKHGVPPNICYVHPNTRDIVKNVGVVEVKPLRTVLIHHIWIGMEERK